MRVVVQRVEEASVRVTSKLVSEIKTGLLILVGVEKGDEEAAAEWLAAKVGNMRIFNDETGVMNRSLIDVGGEVLAVSQFTLTASTRKGNRPSYFKAAGHELAIPLYDKFCSLLSEIIGKEVKKGIFGADMKVSLVNDGPVTIILDSNLRE